MGPDYESRLRLRRAGGVAGPLVLLPLAAWFYVAAPVSGDPTAPSVPPASTAPVAQAPEPRTPGGVVVRAEVLPDGSVEVVETVRLAGSVTSIDLAPPDLARAGPTFADAEPVYDGVQVVAAGRPAVAVQDLAVGRLVALGAPTTELEVRYRVEGTSVRTVPSPDGRALGALAPLTVASGLPVGFEVSGTPLRALTCPLLPADDLLCGTDDGSGTVRTEARPATTALVVVQLDLDG